MLEYFYLDTLVLVDLMFEILARVQLFDFSKNFDVPIWMPWFDKDILAPQK